MRVQTIDEFKPLEKVYAIPTGNNRCRYQKDDGCIEFDVISVGRKYVKLSKSESLHMDNYLPSTGATQGEINRGYGGNAGYIFFDSNEAVEKYRERLIIERRLLSHFSITSAYSQMSDDDIDAIHEIYKKYVR